MRLLSFPPRAPSTWPHNVTASGGLGSFGNSFGVAKVATPRPSLKKKKKETKNFSFNF